MCIFILQMKQFVGLISDFNHYHFHWSEVLMLNHLYSQFEVSHVTGITYRHSYSAPENFMAVPRPLKVWFTRLHIKRLHKSLLFLHLNNPPCP